MRAKSEIRQYFYGEFVNMLAGWSISQLTMMTRFPEMSNSMRGKQILDRKPGSTIICFTEETRSLLAQEMVDFMFPGAESTEKPKGKPVDIKYNPSILRAIKSAHSIILKKLESSERILKDLNQDGETEKMKCGVFSIGIEKLFCRLVFMDDALFMIPDIAYLKGGGCWTATYSDEEIAELRVLIQP